MSAPCMEFISSGEVTLYIEQVKMESKDISLLRCQGGKEISIASDFYWRGWVKGQSLCYMVFNFYFCF